MSPLEQLLSQPQQLHLLRFFVFHPDEDFTLAELQERFGKRAVKKEQVLKHLKAVGAINESVREESGETAYRVMTKWLLYPEFRALFVKSQLLVEHDLVRKLEKSGHVKLLILAGLFVGQRNAPTDVFIVGSVNHRRVARLLKSFEKDLDQEVRYTVLSPTEYHYRKNVGDRFLYSILENRHLVVLDVIERARTSQAKTVSQKKKRL